MLTQKVDACKGKACSLRECVCMVQEVVQVVSLTEKYTHYIGSDKRLLTDKWRDVITYNKLQL